MNKTRLYRRLYHWYEQEHRVLPWRETDDPYKIWVSEIILQQTRVAQGLSYYLRFVEQFPDVHALAAASEDEVLHLWQGLGYYTRARNLHRAARYVAEHGGIVGGTDSNPAARFRQLCAMPGVGDYTAGAIASFAFDLPYPALDGNVYRVLARLYDCDMAFDTTAGKRYFRQLAEELLDTAHPRLFNSAIMEFGALQCVPQTPDCAACPLQDFCEAYAHHTASLLPVRKARTPLRDRYLNYTLYITREGMTLLHKREAQDIWRHLYEFPLVESDALLPVPEGCKRVDITHTLSHQRLHARFHIEPVESLPDLPGCIAIPLRDIDAYALARLTEKALEELKVDN